MLHIYDDAFVVFNTSDVAFDASHYAPDDADVCAFVVVFAIGDISCEVGVVRSTYDFEDADIVVGDRLYVGVGDISVEREAQDA